MAVKIQYSLRLHGDTKCPNCGHPIAEIGPGVYACHPNGHILEPFVLVTLRPKPPQPAVKATAVRDGDVQTDGWVTNDGHKRAVEVQATDPVFDSSVKGTKQ